MAEKQIDHRMVLKAISNQLKYDVSAVNLERFETSSGAKAATNLACDIVRIKAFAEVENANHELDYIVKLKPVDKGRTEMLREVRIKKKTGHSSD